jgi:hypothetical protein
MVAVLDELAPDEAAATLVEAHRGDPSWLDAFEDELDRRRSGAELARILRVWGLTRTDAGALFGISRQALSKWIDDGVPTDRAEAVADLAAATDLLVRHLKRDRIPAVVRRAAPALGGTSLVGLLADGDTSRLLAATRAMFRFGDLHA